QRHRRLHRGQLRPARQPGDRTEPQRAVVVAEYGQHAGLRDQVKQVGQVTPRAVAWVLEAVQANGQCVDHGERSLAAALGDDGPARVLAVWARLEVVLAVGGGEVDVVRPTADGGERRGPGGRGEVEGERAHLARPDVLAVRVGQHQVGPVVLPVKLSAGLAQ